MPDKDDKARRKEILRKVRDQQRQKTHDAFPASVLVLKGLFDFLNQKLSDNDCDDTLRFAREYIQRNTTDADGVIRWLEENGGHCDCEALDNVEQVVSDAVPGYEDLGADARRVN
jgi:hypothetical protein